MIWWNEMMPCCPILDCRAMITSQSKSGIDGIVVCLRENHRKKLEAMLSLLLFFSLDWLVTKNQIQTPNASQRFCPCHKLKRKKGSWASFLQNKLYWHFMLSVWFFVTSLSNEKNTNHRDIAAPTLNHLLVIDLVRESIKTVRPPMNCYQQSVRVHILFFHVLE